MAKPHTLRRILREFLMIASVMAAGLTHPLAQAADAEPLTIGLTASRATIAGVFIESGVADAATVVMLGGLEGNDTSTAAVRAAAESYAAANDSARPVNLYAIATANPESSPLVFPPTGRAYSDNTESYALWRWLGLNGADRVVIVGQDNAGLAEALSSMAVAGVAPIPSLIADLDADLQSILADSPAPSPASVELEWRRARSPFAFANQLSPIYGQAFDPPIYTDGMALLAHLKLGNLEHVEALAAPYIDGTRNSLEGRFGVSTLVLAGHLVFAELAELTGNPSYLARAQAAADLSFDENGEMLEAVPGHGEMSDAIFMGASILAAVGNLTGEQRYFDMAVRQIDFMNELVHRDDGLFQHSPLTDAAWGRGNGFAAIGYTLTLSKLPESHPDYPRLLNEYRSYMQTLAGWQNTDGSWSQVVDYPGSYHETSSTAIIGFSMQRGLNRGWLPRSYEDNVSRAFSAVLARTDRDGGFIDVSESTNKQESLDAYLMREGLAGRDTRTGSFAMLFATERATAGSTD